MPGEFFEPADDFFLKIQLDRMTSRPAGRAGAPESSFVKKTTLS